MPQKASDKTEEFGIIISCLSTRLSFVNYPFKYFLISIVVRRCGLELNVASSGGSSFLPFKMLFIVYIYAIADHRECILYCARWFGRRMFGLIYHLSACFCKKRKNGVFSMNGWVAGWMITCTNFGILFLLMLLLFD